MRKCKVLAILLSLCLIAGLSQGALAGSLSIPAGTTEVNIPFRIMTSNGDFAGVQFTVSFTSGLELKTYTLNSEIFSATGQPLVVEKKNGDLFIGTVTSGNYYSPASNGQVDVCDMVFTYSGSAPQSVTLYDIKIARLVNLNTTSSEEYGPISFSIERGAGGIVIDDPSNPLPSTNPPGGGGGGGGGGGNDGGGGGDTGTSAGTGADTAVDDTKNEPEPSTSLTDNQRPSSAADVAKIVYAPFISGYPDGTVKPDGQLARAELAQLIFNLFGSGNNNTADYSDMDQSHWAFNAVGFCQQEGFMLGYPDGTFLPEQTVTRAELSTALVRIKNLALTPTHPFTDIGEHWAKEYIGAASAGGLVLGYPDGTFQPDNPVTRAEAVTMICRAEERDEKLFDMTKTFSDLQESFWGYNFIMNAANGYNYEG